MALKISIQTLYIPIIKTNTMGVRFGKKID